MISRKYNPCVIGGLDGWGFDNMDRVNATAFSSDVLRNSGIGLWAFELDEGRAPRMFSDETMLNLIGLDTNTTPEEAFRTWYDHIDSAHYKEVAAAVEKMKTGVRAEVQFPWRRKDGIIQIVRMFGVRNMEYEKGIRIEGSYTNITDLMHFQKKSTTELLAALSDTFSCLYFVTPDTGDYEFYLNNNNVEIDSILATLKKRANFFEDAKRDMLQVVIPEDWHIVTKALSQENFLNIAKTGESQSFEVRWFYGKNRDIIWVKEKLIRTKDENGTYKVVVGFENITAKKEQELKLRNALDQTKRQLDIISSMAGMFYCSYYIDMTNDSFVELNPLENDKRSDKIRDIFGSSGDAQKKFDEMCKNFIASDNTDEVKKFTRLSSLNKRLKEKEAISIQFEGPTLGWIEGIFVAADRDEKRNCKHVIFAIRDIDEQKRKEIKQQEEIMAALADPLTGSRNRTAMGWAYNGEYAHNISVGIMECDLNGLKQKNDTEGHAAGDRYICKAAKLLMESFGEYNVYRVGGDEFVVIALNLLEEEFNNKVNRFAERCSESDVSISFGTNYREYFDEPFEILLKEADLKMYNAKREHYKNARFDRRQVDQNKKLYDDLIKALSDNYESVFFVDCDNDTIQALMLNPSIPKRTSQKLYEKSSYRTTMKGFVEKLVAEKDRGILKKACSINYLDEALTSNKAISFEYSSLIGGEEVPYKIKFANMDCDGVLHRMAIGFTKTNFTK